MRPVKSLSKKPRQKVRLAVIARCYRPFLLAALGAIIQKSGC